MIRARIAIAKSTSLFRPTEVFVCCMSTRSRNFGAHGPVKAGEYLLCTKSRCCVLTVGKERFVIQITTALSVLAPAPNQILVLPRVPNETNKPEEIS